MSELNYWVSQDQSTTMNVARTYLAQLCYIWLIIFLFFCWAIMKWKTNHFINPTRLQRQYFHSFLPWPSESRAHWQRRQCRMRMVEWDRVQCQDHHHRRQDQWTERCCHWPAQWSWGCRLRNMFLFSGARLLYPEDWCFHWELDLGNNDRIRLLILSPLASQNIFGAFYCINVTIIFLWTSQYFHHHSLL